MDTNVIEVLKNIGFDDLKEMSCITSETFPISELEDMVRHASSHIYMP